MKKFWDDMEAIASGNEPKTPIDHLHEAHYVQWLGGVQVPTVAGLHCLELHKELDRVRQNVRKFEE